MLNESISCFIALCLTEHHRCIFYKLKARPSTSKKIITCFIVILTILWWSGTKPAISSKMLRVICVDRIVLFQGVMVMYCISYIMIWKRPI